MPTVSKSPLVKVGAIAVAFLFVSIFISPSVEWTGFAIAVIACILIWQFPAWGK
jgi:hypothetical protein